jgi:hypothetical protein
LKQAEDSQNNKDDNDHQQEMNEIAGARKIGIDTWAEKSESQSAGKMMIYVSMMLSFLLCETSGIYSSYDKDSPPASIDRGVFVSVTWGIGQKRSTNQ